MKNLLLIIALLCGYRAIADNVVPCDFTSISSDISSNTTLYSNTLYRLEGCIHVTSGHTLTIQQNTVILAEKASNATLVIDEGAQLISQGTAGNPVVFTTDQATGYQAPGDWGGIIVLGDAPNNNNNSITISGRACSSLTAGGSTSNDNSGDYVYMRVEYAKSGLTMVSVGSGTNFHDVMVSYASENAVELLGGLVDIKNFVSYNAYRADILATLGNQSRAQRILGLRLDANAHISTGELSNGIVFKNNDDAVNSYAGYIGSDNTHPIFSNVTLLGSKYCGATGLSADFKNGVLMLNNTEGGIYNAIIDGWQTGYRIEHSTTVQNANNNGAIQFQYSSFHNNPTAAFSSTTWSSPGCESNMSDWLTTSISSCDQPGYQALGSAVGYSATICGSYSSTPPDFALSSPNTSSPDYLSDDLLNNSGFFEAMDNRGAFDDEDWTVDFANWNPIDFDVCSRRKGSATTGVTAAVKQAGLNLTLVPNPANGSTRAEFTTTQSGNVIILIVNSFGQVVRNMNMELNKGNQQINVNTDDISTGAYIISVQMADQSKIYSTLIVQ